ncbi:MAG: hypothetical protein ACSLE5_07545 [Porticoccaceae bacterium]
MLETWAQRDEGVREYSSIEMPGLRKLDNIALKRASPRRTTSSSNGG